MTAAKPDHCPKCGYTAEDKRLRLARAYKHPVTCLIGVGRVAADLLATRGITTIGQFVTAAQVTVDFAGEGSSGTRVRILNAWDAARRKYGDAELGAAQDAFDVSPERYHAGLKLLWDAIEGQSLEGDTVHEKVAARITELEAEVERLRAERMCTIRIDQLPTHEVLRLLREIEAAILLRREVKGRTEKFVKPKKTDTYIVKNASVQASFSETEIDLEN
jgi:uncharacterized small protein (DUF1192 family)